MKILAIAAHPDDETLGCGGTLLKHLTKGDTLCWMIVTQAHPAQYSAQSIQTETLQIKRVARRYKIDALLRLGFPAAGLETVPLRELIESMRAAIATTKPGIVYLVHQGDIHSDHQLVYKAALSAMKPAYMTRMRIKRLLSYETLSSTEAGAPGSMKAFIPNVYSDITPYLDQKIKIMDLYKTETQTDPMPRGPSAIRALARYRGAAIGTHYAEAFMLIREAF